MAMRPEVEGKGLCFHRTVGFVLDVPPAKLYVGIFRGGTPEEIAANPAVSAIPFIHCWAQINEFVYAPTTIEAQGGRLRPFAQAEYYERNGTKVLGIMGRHELKQLSKEYGLAQHLLYHTPVRGDAAFSDIILNKLEVSYTLTDQKGVIPAGE
jgi:hypothetical protein